MTWQNARDAVAGATLIPGQYVSIHRVHAIYNRLEQGWTDLLEFADLLRSVADEGEIDVVGVGYQMSTRFRGPVLLLPDGGKVIPVLVSDGPVKRSWQNAYNLGHRDNGERWTFHQVPRYEQ